jgi:tetratricopeptide (TPR) repeat protein
MARKQLIYGVACGLTALVLWVACVPLISWGCGPEYYYAVFTYDLYPDYPLDGFARGRLGVLNPGFARSYLYVAYRYLSNKPFDVAEGKALLRLWDERLNEDLKHEFQADNATKPWLEARRAVPGSRPVHLYYVYASPPGPGYDFFVNITPDAFRVAAQTLADRIERFGADSKIVSDWLAAQDMVFSSSADESQNEFSREKPEYGLIPDPPAPGLPTLAKADGMYQRASAFFYAGDYDQALKLYRRISADASSPWSTTSRFMIARCLLRKATLTPTQGVDNTQAALAEAELKGIIANAGLEEFHPSASRLLAYLTIRFRPEQRLGELAAALQRPGQGDTLFQLLWDYTVLLDSFGERGDGQKSPVMVPNASNAKGFEPRPEMIARDDMTDWILTFQSKDPKALDYALMKWRGTKSLPWLVSCLTKMRAGHPGLDEVLQAAEKVPTGSPGFTAVAFHRSRLLAESGNKDKAREIVDDLLSRRESLTQPSLNLFLAESMSLARSYDDFLVCVARQPAAIILWSPDDESGIPKDLEKLTDLKYYRRGERLIDADGATVINRDFPLHSLTAIAASEKLDPNTRREVATVAWTRAVLLGRPHQGKQLATVLERLVPEIKKEDLRAYVEAKGDEARKFAAAYILLKTPGLTPIVGAGLPRQVPIDQVGILPDYGRWWCARPSPEYGGDDARTLQIRAAILGSPLLLLHPDGKVPVPAFLSPDEKRAASEEWRTLSSLDSAPNFLSRQVLAWAQHHPDDPRVPEALHLAVRATRYGCTDRRTTSELSKKAFLILHRRYPKSVWTAKTKRWY